MSALSPYSPNPRRVNVLIDACVWGGARDTLRSAGHQVERVGDWSASARLTLFRGRWSTRGTQAFQLGVHPLGHQLVSKFVPMAIVFELHGSAVFGRDADLA